MNTLATHMDKMLSERGPLWLQKLRKEAMDRVIARGFPSAREEAWRYTNVEPLSRIPFELAPVDHKGGRVQYDLLDRSEFYRPDDLKLVFVNGLYNPELSVPGKLPRGVIVGSLAEVLRENPSLVEPYLLQSFKNKDVPFASLNTAMIRDGAFLLIPKGCVIREPIYLCHFSWADDRPTISHPRNLIVAEEDSQATVIEIYGGGGQETYFTNAVTEIIAGPHTVIDHYKVQQESGRATHIASIDIEQGLESRVSTFSISLGSSLARNDIRSSLNAEGVECTMNGLYMVTGRQHVDHQTDIDHKKPHGTSNELYKGILSGQSRGVFNGRIRVEPDACKTIARQTNKNLILSDEALIHTKPLLEIFNSDVKCNHGATIGRLDENQVFYLRSRGLEEAHARNLLIYAFASELVRKIRINSLQVALERWIFRRLLDATTEWVGV